MAPAFFSRSFDHKGPATSARSQDLLNSLLSPDRSKARSKAARAPGGVTIGELTAMHTGQRRPAARAHDDVVADDGW